MLVPFLLFLPTLGSVAQSLVSYPVVSLDLKPAFDNVAAAPDGSADFNGKGASFDSNFLPTGNWTYDGIKVCAE